MWKNICSGDPTGTGFAFSTLELLILRFSDALL